MFNYFVHYSIMSGNCLATEALIKFTVARKSRSVTSAEHSEVYEELHSAESTAVHCGVL